MSTLFAPKALQEWNDSGTYYSIAYTAQDAGLVYNKTIFHKAGITTVPGTWAQLFADCAKIAKLGDVPVGMDMGDTAYGDPVPSLMAALFSNSMQPVFDQIAGSSTANITVPELVKAIEDGRFSMKSPGFSEAWNLLKQFSRYFESGADSYGSTPTQNSSLLFARGKVGMVYVGSYEFPTFTSDHLSYGIFPLPQLTRQTWTNVSAQYQGTGVMSYWDDWPWSISAAAAHKGTLSLAENFLQWLAVPKHQDTFASNLGDVPVARTGATVTPSASQSAPLLSVVDYIVQHPSRITTALTAVLGPSGETQEVKIMQEYLDGQLGLSGALGQEEALLRTSAQATRSWAHV
jgi:ABC-type glycerol-3-phosphate transport system substrate-binding protein